MAHLQGGTVSQIVNSQVKHYADEASKLRREYQMTFIASIWEAISNLPTGERSSMFSQVQAELTRRSTAARNKKKADKPLQTELLDQQAPPPFPRPGSVVEPTVVRSSSRRNWLSETEDHHDEIHEGFPKQG